MPIQHHCPFGFERRPAWVDGEQGRHRQDRRLAEQSIPLSSIITVQVMREL